MTVRNARQADLPALSALWRAAFGDTQETVDLFFAHHNLSDTAVCERDGAVRAMLHALPCRLVLLSGEALPAAYLYAIATDARCRGQGMASALLNFAHDTLRQAGVACMLLVPADGALFDFYAARGYHAAAYRSVRTLAPQAAGRCDMRAVSAAEYAALRARYQAGAYVAYGETLLSYQEALCRQTGGGLYALTCGGRPCCASAAREGTRLRIEEFLPADCAETGAAALCAALGAQEALLDVDGGAPFGMVHWLSQAPPQAEPIRLAFAFG